MVLKTTLELPAEISSKPRRGQTLTAGSEKEQLSKQGGTAVIPSLTIISQGCFNFRGHNAKNYKLGENMFQKLFNKLSS